MGLAGRPQRPQDAEMSKALDDVLARALSRDPKSRAELVSDVLASLEGPPDADAEAAWEAEIRRRVAAIEAGTAKLEPWEALKARIEQALRGQ
jgi:putative addiction module component (TIGR02574 family)